MARRLPADPIKRRLQWFKRIYQHLNHFQALLEAGSMPMPGIITTPEGEEIYLSDLLIGIEELPPRQREAFQLICLEGYTETAATKVMLPHSRWSTPVQQYADTALARMVAAYDRKQAGAWAMLETKKAGLPQGTRTRKARGPSAASLLLQQHLAETLDHLLDRRRQLDAEIVTVRQLLGVA